MNFCKFCMCELKENSAECPVCHKSLTGVVPAHHLKPGTVLRDVYLIGAAIGEGGFGITYVGKDLNLGRKIAVKEYYPDGFVNRATEISNAVSCSVEKSRAEVFDKGKRRFLDEARTLAQFDEEENIVRVYTCFEENNTAYFVMEYLEGQTLKACLESRGTMSPQETLALLRPAAAALEKVHGAGLIHRDIAPDNIMILKNGKVKLIDFGAARDAAGNRSLTVVLKHGYAPEEQYRSKGEQGPWTDIYALCATMYKCITGETPDEAPERMKNDRLKAPSALGVQIDPTFEKALMKGLSVYAEDRYQSVSALLAALEGNCDAASACAAAETPSDRPAKAPEQDVKTVLIGEAIPNPPTDPDKTVLGGKTDENDPDKTVFDGTADKNDPDKTVFGAPASPAPPQPPAAAPETSPAPPRGGKKSKKPLIIALIAAVLVLAGMFIALFAAGVFEKTGTQNNTADSADNTSSVNADQTTDNVSAAAAQCAADKKELENQGYTVTELSSGLEKYETELSAASGSIDRCLIAQKDGKELRYYYFVTEERSVKVFANAKPTYRCRSEYAITYAIEFDNEEEADAVLTDSIYPAVSTLSSDTVFERVVTNACIVDENGASAAGKIKSGLTIRPNKNNTGFSITFDCQDARVAYAVILSYRNLLPDIINEYGLRSFVLIEFPSDVPTVPFREYSRKDLAVICRTWVDSSVTEVQSETATTDPPATEGLSYLYNPADDSYIVSRSFSFTGGTLVIPSEHDGKPVTAIEDYAFRGCSSLTSVTIPDSVTSIGNYAFDGCTSLTSVTIPDSVTEIGDFAFSDCTSLTSVTIPDSVTEIGSYAFSGCSSVSSMTVASGNTKYHSAGNCIIETASKTLIAGCMNSVIPKDGSVTSIGDYAFSGCSSLTSVTIPDSVTEIGSYVFRCCSNLTSVTIPDSVTEIGNEAFYGCSSLTSVTIPDSVTSIGSWAFGGCSSLTRVTIPASVVRIGVGAFSGCTSLTNMTVESGNPVYHSAGNCIIETERKTLIIGLTNSVIPDDGSVTEIGWYAFENCTNLASVTIPDGVTEIGAGAFSGCTSLTSVTIPDGVTTIVEYAFENCTNLASVTIPDGVTEIGWYAFYECTSLTSVTIPAGVTEIRYDAFYGCTSLSTVFYRGTQEQWNRINFGDNNDPLLNADLYFLK